MNLHVHSINFETGRIILEISGRFTVRGYEHLGSYLKYCEQMGLSHIAVRYKSTVPEHSVLMLQDLEKQYLLEEVSPIDDAAQDAPEMCCGGRTSDADGAAYSIAHRFNLDDLQSALDYTNRFILLAGHAMRLDAKTLAYLRLCVYELGMNTVEHAKFASNHPAINIAIRSAADWVELCYEDNSDMFSTVVRSGVDIEEKIRNGSKRGLGLAMLQKIAEEIDYDWDGTWNRTTMKITRYEGSQDANRRTSMNDFSLNVAPSESNGYLVIKPRGSINSNTAPSLDAQFDELINQKKYKLVVDLAETDFISSSGIGVFLGTVASLRAKGGDLILMNVPQLVDDIFGILNIKDHFRFVNGIDELEAVAKS
jgi:anti-sigma B factor antagonist